MEDLIEKMKELKPKEEMKDSAIAETHDETDGIKSSGKLTPKERAKAYRLKQIEKNPNWDREHAKKWRESHPENYYYGQARFFFKKLTVEQRNRLLNELQV
jgi:catalase